MGNRFRDMVGYQGLITAHGTLAAITFLFVVPGAIFMARFYHRNPHTALRFHIWLQIMTVLLSTAAVVLGFQAVGRERSLTNPHHGIGVALYTLVITQFLGGSIIHKLEKGKERWKIPLKLMVRSSRKENNVRPRLTLTVPSMVGPYSRSFRHCADSSWSDSVGISLGALHPLRRMDLSPSDCILCLVVYKPARDGL